MSSRTSEQGYWVKLRGWLIWRTRIATRRAAGLCRTIPRAATRSVESGAVTAGTLAYRLGGELIRFPHRREHISLPGPLEIDGYRFDILGELAEYTGLDAELTATLVRREVDDFRTEWYALPSRYRQDSWFYTSSRTYLFANAVHVYESPELVDQLVELCPAGGTVLEFGGGSGNLTLALAARGLQVDFLELSALQKDFVRYRVAKHSLEYRVSVLDRWSAPRESSYDLICAFDVFEHLPNVEHVLDTQIVPALKAGGALAERSPFVRNLANPMHHEDTLGFDSLLEERGFHVASDDASCRVWRFAMTAS